MKIITCIKQVPASSQVEVDPNTGVLIRDGFNVKMNPYDLYALEAAFTMKEMQEDITVHATTMGPPSAKEVLHEALMMGADEASIISDRNFAGADVLATAYTLSQMVEHIGNFDVIIAGKQTTDGDTAQVGPEMAEFLNIPHVPYVKEILKLTAEYVEVKSSYDDCDEIVRVTTPCLLTIDKGAFVPRLPSYRRKVQMKGYNIKMVTLKDLKDNDPLNYGLNGSPTQVEEIFPPSKKSESVVIKTDVKGASETLVNILKESRFL